MSNSLNISFPFRIGFGYDVHRLIDGRKLILCGVDIPYRKGLLGHSDADVMLHALIDALLGAAGLGDIGRMFPDTDMRYKDISSLKLLSEVVKRLKEHKWQIINIDLTLVAQAPKISPYIAQMKKNISDTCNLDLCQINIKATTTEGLGFVGEGKAMAAHAVCLIGKNITDE